VLIDELMTTSGVKFGTSGARGLATAMTDRVCYAYAHAFLRYVRDQGALAAGAEVGLAGDLRPSTERILRACARAARDLGLEPRDHGRIPTPALAAYGLARGVPTLMVTGSHIPDDRNGIKFNLPSGEILKDDEAAIRALPVIAPGELFTAAGAFVDTAAAPLPPASDAARSAYLRRYLDFFPEGCLRGLRVGVYEHSSVARDCLAELLEALGAEVRRLARADRFVPVDTEAIRPEDVALAREWCADGAFDALVSADGDGDRPLVADARGEWLRGDIAGILCARQLGAAAVVTPVSSNTAVERCGGFTEVLRTRIGSPYVIAGMTTLLGRGLAPVVGYEANGGFLLGSAIERDGRVLAALPTRDAVIVALALLQASAARALPLAALAAELPPRFTASDRLREFPSAQAQSRIAALAADPAAIGALFGEALGAVAEVDQTDGLRLTFAAGEIVHLRPSGNAPELRVYAEADSAEGARARVEATLALLERWRG